MVSRLKNFFKRQGGMGTVEIVIIVAVLVGIALIFRDAILVFATDIMSGVFGEETIPAGDINSGAIREGNPIR